jgi:hypothetical protein
MLFLPVQYLLWLKVIEQDMEAVKFLLKKVHHQLRIASVRQALPFLKNPVRKAAIYLLAHLAI